MSTRAHIRECIECTGEVLGLARLLAHAWLDMQATGGAAAFRRVARLLDELSASVQHADARDAALDGLLVAALQETNGTLELIIPGDEEPTLIQPVYGRAP
jgi:hypothetical protein